MGVFDTNYVAVIAHDCDEKHAGSLKATDRTVRLPGSSHAEAALASRANVLVLFNGGVVK